MAQRNLAVTVGEGPMLALGDGPAELVCTGLPTEQRNRAEEVVARPPTELRNEQAKLVRTGLPTGHYGTGPRR